MRISIIIQHAMLRLFHIFELPFFDRPDKHEPAGRPQAERKNNQYNQAFIHFF